MDFVYDNTGKPYALKYDGTTYYYVLNLQGDVISIITHWGESYGSYTYDAWGNVISQSGSIASINPICYRGYYYDSETGLYYLGSRYYDPQVKRFVNADGAALATINPYSDGLTDKNYFAYCDNNPTSRSDDGGEFWNIVAGAVIGGVVSAAISAADSLIESKGQSIDYDAMLHSAISGALGGGVAASGVGIVGQRLVGAATSAMDTFYSEVKSGTPAGLVAVKTIASAGMGALTAGPGMNTKEMQSMRTAAKTAKYTLRQSGVHPRVKKMAKKAISSFRNYAKKQYVSAFQDTAIYGFSSWVLGKVIKYACK